MHNKIALKLTLYFAAVLLVFALVVGGSFAHFFREHTVDIKSTELKQRAVRIAEVLSENAGWLEKRGGIANTRFISYINNITMEDVWVVNSDRELKLPQRMNHHMGMHRRMMHADTQAQVPPLKEFPRRSVTFEQLSDVTRNCVEQAFAGTVSVAEDFNPVREETMLCAAAPVYDENGAIQAAVLLHYPVQGLQSATWEGVRILLLSCAIALLLVSFLSVLFSWKFTRPLNRMKEVAQKMAEHDYTERCNIKQNDEIGALAATLDELGSRLLDADEAGRKLEKLRRSFIANISHELRTPLQILLSQLEAMLDGIYEADRERLEAMRAEVARTGELLNELEDRLIYENDAFDLNITQVNVSDLAHRVAIGHEGGFAQKKLDFIYNIEPDVIIEADSVRLAQVLINLLSNSIKYTQAGGASLSLKREGRNVVIEITDSGEGMDEETAKNIINRSSQAFKAVNSKGVGLYIAKLIVDKHGWALDIESHKGRGTTVRIIM